jgi:hypothetical protein
MSGNSHIITGGFDRTNLPHASDQNTWYDLLNLRPANGALHQTPVLVTKQTMAQFAAEGASQTRYIGLSQNAAGSMRYLVGTEKNLRYLDPDALSTQAVIPCVLQTQIPVNTDVTGQVLLYGINATDFAADTDHIDIVIEAGGTTFKWRRNAAAYTTAVPIAATVTLGANGLIAAFVSPTSTYTAADTWIWTRTTFPYAATYPTHQVRAASYKKDVYLAGYDRQILRVRNDFATSVGYQRIFGKYVSVFYNHLVVSQFAQGTYSGGAIVDGYSATTTPWQVSWSDRDNPDLFYATSLNEADTFDIPSNGSINSTIQGITGQAPLNNVLAIYLPDDIYIMNYVGLPNVMQIDRFSGAGVGSIFQNGVVNTPVGHFFIARDNIYRFDGQQLQKVGFPVKDKLFGEFLTPSDSKFQQLYGYYDADKAEVVWHYWIAQGSYYQAKQVIYQLDEGRWYFRNVPSSDSSTDVRCATSLYKYYGRQIYGAYQALLVDYLVNVDSASTSVKDTVISSFGVAITSYAQPYAESQDILDGDIYSVKTKTSLYIDASYTSASADYVTAYFQARNFISTARVMDALTQNWTPLIAERKLSLPQNSGNVSRFGFKFVGTKPLDCVLNGWADFTYSKKSEQ